MKLVGLDIGGTKIEGVLFDEEFRVLEKIRRPTQADKNAQVIINNIISVAKALLGNNKFPVGVAMAGFSGSYGMPNMMQLVGLDLPKILAEKLNTTVAMENDGQCFALAEHTFGAAKDVKNVVGVVLGTGIGAGAIVDGHLLKGKDCAAAHIGHMIIDPSGLRCRCGQKGDFESWCSGPNIVRRYIEARGKIKNPDPRKIFSTREKIAEKVVDETYDKLAIGFVNIINIFNPEIIVVGGGLSNLPIYARLNRLVKENSALGLEKGVRIVKNRLGDSAGVYGAAIIARC